MQDRALKSAPWSPDRSVDRNVLVALRIAAARSRCLAHADMFEACAALAINPAREAEAVAVMLFQIFSSHRDMPNLRVYEPAADELSFDEYWLLAALSACERGDDDSFAFLIARRVPKHARRQIAQLLRTLSKKNYVIGKRHRSRIARRCL